MVTAVEELEDLAVLADVASELGRKADPVLADKLAVVLEHHLGRANHSVAKVAVARLFGLTDETVAAWLKRGILQTANDPASPKETVDLASVIDVHQRIERLRQHGVDDKAAWAKLLATGIGEGGEEFTPEDLEIIDLNAHSRGRGLVLPSPAMRADRE
jgi:hypothetical protein